MIHERACNALALSTEAKARRRTDFQEDPFFERIPSGGFKLKSHQFDRTTDKSQVGAPYLTRGLETLNLTRTLDKKQDDHNFMTIKTRKENFLSLNRKGRQSVITGTVTSSK